MRTYEECLDKLLDLRTDMRNAQLSYEINKIGSRYNPTIKDKEDALFWEHETKKRSAEFFTYCKAVGFAFEKTAFEVQHDISNFYIALESEDRCY